MLFKGSDFAKTTSKQRPGKPATWDGDMIVRARGLLTVGVAVAAGLVAFQPVPPAVSQPRPEVEVASVKPNIAGGRGSIALMPGRFRVTNLPLRRLILNAYKAADHQISGAPGWVDTQGWDIEAAANDLKGDRFPMILQSLLEDRFQLKVHREIKEGSVYDLTVAKGGLKMQQVKDGSCTPLDLAPKEPRPPGQNRPTFCGMWPISQPGLLTGTGIAMTDPPGPAFQGMSGHLSFMLGRTVIDKTGLSGMFDIHLEWTPDAPGVEAPTPDTLGPSIFTALREQLGLELKSARGPVQLLVIDHVEKPGEN